MENNKAESANKPESEIKKNWVLPESLCNRIAESARQRGISEKLVVIRALDLYFQMADKIVNNRKVELPGDSGEPNRTVDLTMFF